MAAATAGCTSGGPKVASCTMTFSVRAETEMGDRLVLVGSGDALGNWNPVDHGLELTTTEKDYPLWKSKAVAFQGPIATPLAEYKYVRLTGTGETQWESDGDNRCVPGECKYESVLIDDGHFGTLSKFCAFPDAEKEQKSLRDSFNLQAADDGLRLVVLGDGAAAGHGAPGYKGWAAGLGKQLREKFGYGYTNMAEPLFGAQAAMHKSLAEMLPKPLPQIVVIAFSLELQWLARCPDWDRGTIFDNTIKAFDALVQEAWRLGIRPVLAGLCPHDAFGEEQAKLLQEMDAAMKGLGVPVLDWLPALMKNKESGHWGDNLASNELYPNAAGHERMSSSFDLSIFDPKNVKDILTRLSTSAVQSCFSNGKGLEIKYDASSSEIVMSNSSDEAYEISPGWAELQSSLGKSFKSSPWLLRRGLYVSCSDGKDASGPLSVFIGAEGRVESHSTIPAGCTQKLKHISLLTDSKTPNSKVLFLDGSLGVLKTGDTSFLVFNTATFEYNVHPMWYDARQALKAMPHGVYEDTSGLPFRTAVVSCHGLQSRIKVPARSAIELRHVGDLSSLEQVAVLPLGDRCSIRMLMHKIEFDGPCFPFDLTRTTSLADTVDMVATGFKDMWNPDYLCFDAETGRIYHRKWGGLSFAHEVEWEGGDDPVGNFHPIAMRMQKRYTGRAARFEWACKHAARVMFIRTGCASRDEVINLFERMRERYPGLKFNLLLISDQPSHEFNGLENMKHVCESFDPDRMYEDLHYWKESAVRFRHILQNAGIDARSLYWCPSDLKEAEKELQAAKPSAPEKEQAAKPCAPKKELQATERCKAEKTLQVSEPCKQTAESDKAPCTKRIEESMAARPDLAKKVIGA